MRWGAGKLMEKAPEGMYIGELGYIDLTGDGQPDYAVVATQADADAIPLADKEKYKLNIEILAGNTFELTGGDKGYIRLFLRLINGILLNRSIIIVRYQQKISY